jgi:hypothetical protein
MRKTASLVLILAFTLFSALPTAAGPENLFCSLGQDKEKVRHKKGPEVANRVKDLRRSSKAVRNALAAFERNEKKTGRKPRIEDATSMSFDYEKRSEGVSFLRTSFTPTQFFEGTIEVITVPVYSADGEWQGGIFAYEYDSAGNFLSEYVADVILLPDPTYTYWDAILEVSYDYNGSYLQAGTYSLYEQMGTPVGGWPATSRLLSSNPNYEKASLTQGPIGHPPGYPAWVLLRKPRVKAAVKCTSIVCGASAGGCGFVSIFFAGTPFAPCVIRGCTSAVLGCVAVQVFGP